MPTDQNSLQQVVRTYLDHLAVERGLASNTLAAYRRDLERYTAWLAGRGRSRLTDVLSGDVADFAAHIREGDSDHPPLSTTSAARVVVAVRGMHKFAAREGLVPTDVAHDVRPPAPGKRLPKALDIADVEKLLDAAARDDSPLALRDRALLEFLYGTGARISEALGLDVDDIDAQARAVRIRGKGGKERIVPVGSFALAAVDAYRVRARPGLAAAGRSTPRLFLNSRGGPLSRQSAWAILRTCAERAKIQADVSPHSLRHSFATHLLDGGADVRVVQELLGHASVTTTQVYTLVTVDKLREVYATSHPRAR
ncbi:site-specific tyrosine recombinase XerD [Blastococcus sp. Marseille-P5729]|uniref:site-specific tyrosine recombinase XerD n=1 Tax=Blastococcus sp. Marseille-P5729 TaxID=2086582 RepID=UPI000D10CE77|nr:site-specific tyrosine recombinase XerD [Blastococcus sp. Marseille-P5729]